MVEGLDRFRDFFRGFEETYILIGGTACDQNLAEVDLPFRSTTDLDIILIAEALSPAFVERFWQFIDEGQYNNREADQKDQQFYRFRNPKTAGFPEQLELFSRLPDVITLKEGMTLTPIPVDDELESLSAILMADDYYQFTKSNSTYLNGLHLASSPTLLALKARAFLDLTERKAAGEQVDNKKILKHRNDVFRMLAIIPQGFRQETPTTIQEDLGRFISHLQETKPDLRTVIKNAGLGNAKMDDLFGIVQAIYGLKP